MHDCDSRKNIGEETSQWQTDRTLKDIKLTKGCSNTDLEYPLDDGRKRNEAAHTVEDLHRQLLQH